MSESGSDEGSQILVVDTGVAAKWYLNEELEEEAARILDAGSNGDARLIAPDPVGAEFFNVLWQHHMGHRSKARSLSIAEVEEYWREFASAPLELFRVAPLMNRAVEITIETNVIVYDALFLALAEVGRATLVTADEKTILSRIKDTAYESLGVHLANVDSLPMFSSRTAKGDEGESASS